MAEPTEAARAHPLAGVRAKTPKQQAILDALVAANWPIAVAPFPGALTLGHPDNETRIPTPDYAREEYAPGRAYYPFESYTSLRQLTLLFTVVEQGPPLLIVVTHVLTREAAVPWVRANERSVSLAAAVDWINGEHPAQARPVEGATS